ncbi:alkene reductase [Arachnia propionica]|uniref:Alkene reductase n=1 Tax=Arachnia propionica TaxID=1750 RepID=A0A3P1T6L5_9ACTN|nr:alkene reductase [Arachnia propionica]RRD05151.1 alkene reductase [Arachnia propionica]
MTCTVLTPTRLGAVELSNRLVMAPLTRLRCGEQGIPDDVVVEYYRQRASTGMIVTEGTWPVPEGRSWIGQPGIATEEQAAGWARVAEAVHAAGGRIAMQVMHGGRLSHPEITGSGRVVSASATTGPDPARTPDGKVVAPTAHALTEDEIQQVIQGFVDGARRAIEAGMDAVELHGANGYLIHQFLAPSTNLRDDGWGGSPARRARFAIEVTRAVARAIGADRTGIRLSPENSIQGIDETDAEAVRETYATWAAAVAPLGLAFVDVLHHDPASFLVQEIRRISGAPLMVNTGFDAPSTREVLEGFLERESADAVAVGRPLIANPDLLRRWREGLPENEADASTFYEGGERGYTDYPFAG